MKVIIFIAMFIIGSYGILNYIQASYPLSLEVAPQDYPAINMQLTVETTKPVDLEPNYNLSKITPEVIKEFQDYFVISNYTEFTIIHDGGIMNSYFSEDSKIINMGLIGVENDSEMYKTVLAHEYMHYALHKMGLSNSRLHEALADLYTRYTHREKSKELWGEDNQEREYPYTILTNKIVTENEACLSRVFDKNKKMRNVIDVLNRIQNYCNVDLVEVINQL